MTAKFRSYLTRIILALGLVAALVVANFLSSVHRISMGQLNIPCLELGRPGDECLVGPQMPGWVPLPWVSKHLQHAVIAAEDSRYYEHAGIDWVEIWASLQVNLAQKKYVRGASTITQQLVRMLFLSREKTLSRKIFEALGALYLEMILDKDEILEWYLNIVPFGPGVTGVADASQKFFGTRPVFLTIEQAINLALVLPSPSNWSEGLRNERLTNGGRRRFRHILTEMYQQRFITKDQWQYTQATGDFGWPLENATFVEPESTQ